MTGFPFINCKKALDQFENDIEQAEKWLREQAQKEGWAKASKLQSRPMSNGLVGMVGDSRTATMVEVNCETDFVAKNKKFISLVSDLAVACQAHFKTLGDKKSVLSASALGDLSTSEGKKLSDLVTLQVGSIGENMSLRRAVHVKASESTFLTSYIHAAGPEIRTDSCCELGRFGSVIEVEQLKEGNAMPDEGEEVSLDKLCRQVAQHIVGMGPLRVGDPNVDKPKNSKSEHPKEGENVLDGDPKEGENVAEGEDSDQNNNSFTDLEKRKVEEDLLIFQEFLLDPSVSVGDLLDSHNIAVKDFVRFECGEDLGEETS